MNIRTSLIWVWEWNNIELALKVVGLCKTIQTVGWSVSFEIDIKRNYTNPNENNNTNILC